MEAFAQCLDKYYEILNSYDAPSRTFIGANPFSNYGVFTLCILCPKLYSSASNQHKNKLPDPESLNNYLMQYVVPSLFGCLRGFGRVSADSQPRLSSYLFPFGLDSAPALPTPPHPLAVAQSVPPSPARHAPPVVWSWRIEQFS